MSRQRIRRAISEWDCLGVDPHWQPVPHPLYKTPTDPPRPRRIPAAPPHAQYIDGRRVHRIPVQVVKTGNGRRIVTPERMERNNNTHIPDKHHHPQHPRYFTHSKSMESIDGNWTLKSRDGQKAERNRKTNLAVWNSQVSQKFEEMKGSQTAPRPSTSRASGVTSHPSTSYTTLSGSSTDLEMTRSNRYPVGMAVAKSAHSSSSSSYNDHPPKVVLERGGQTFMYVHDKHGYQPVPVAAETLPHQSNSSSSSSSPHKYVKHSVSTSNYSTTEPPRLKSGGKSNSTPNLLDDVADMDSVFVEENIGPKSSTPRDYNSNNSSATRDYASQTVPRNFNSSREDILQGEVVRVQVPGYGNNRQRYHSDPNLLEGEDKVVDGNGNHLDVSSIKQIESW